MCIVKSFRYRLDPNNQQIILCNRNAGSCRFIYNFGLERKRINPSLSYADLRKELTQLKERPETKFLAEAPSQALQQSLKNLESAWKNYLTPNKKGKRSGFPKFKKRGNNDSFRYPQGVKVKNGTVYLPKIGWVKFYDSRPLEGAIAQTIVKREGKHWFVTFVCAVPCKIPCEILIKKTLIEKNIVGIDVGIKHLAVLSTGEIIENPRFLDKKLLKLKKEQKDLSRKVKHSNNYKKQAAKVGRQHTKIKNSRKDFLHKETTRLIKNHDALVVETLTISGMIQNRKLSRCIADASMSMFLSMLEYKAVWHGKHFVKIPKFLPTSKTCSFCQVKQDMPLNIRTYTCNSCGLVMDRDLNASINIRSAGRAVLKACGAIGIS